MGILDWFVNRPAQFDADRRNEETIERAIDKAVQLTNPRLKLVRDYRENLRPAVEAAIDHLRALVLALPPPIEVSADLWAENPSLRAFFASRLDVAQTVGRSSNLRTLFDKYQTLDCACFVLGMACEAQRVFGMGLQGEAVQREVAQSVLVFSDHKARICGRDEQELRRLIGTQAFEYLVAEAIAKIGEEHAERRELEEERALIRARLRLLQQQGPGLGSFAGAQPEKLAVRERLEAQLLDNERQLEACVGQQDVLDFEFEGLKDVLADPTSYLAFEAERRWIDTLNVLCPAGQGAEIEFTQVRLLGAQKATRAFVLGRFARTGMCAGQIDFAGAERLL